MQGNDHRLQRRSVLALAAMIVLLMLGSVAGAVVVVSDPNGGETVTGTYNIEFTASTSEYSNPFTADIYLSSTPGTKDHLIMGNVDLITEGGFSKATGWANRDIDVYETNDAGNGWARIFEYDDIYYICTASSTAVISCYESVTGISGWSQSSKFETVIGACSGNAPRNGFEVFNFGSDLYIMSGRDGALCGLKWNDGENRWEDDEVIENGLRVPAAGNARGVYHYFEDAGTAVIIENHSYTTPSVKAYTWEGVVDGWEVTDSYTRDFNLFGGGENQYSDVFVYDGDIFYLETERTTATTGLIKGLKYDRGTSAWKANTDIKAGLYSATNAAKWGISVITLGTILRAVEFNYTDDIKWSIYDTAGNFYDTKTPTPISISWDSEGAANGDWFMDIYITATTAGAPESSDDASAGTFTLYNYTADEPPIPPPEGADAKVGIYITAADWSTGIIAGTTPSDYSGFMHNWVSFAAGSAGSYIGKIIIDGSLAETCNHTWDCLLDLETGTHTYSFYSTNGGWQYTGTFSLDQNTSFVKIYAPMSYNIFNLWETSAEQTNLTCADIYSLTAGGEVSTNKRISTGLYIGSDYLNWNSTQVIPQNCYSDQSVPGNYPYPLPSWVVTTEPAVFMYSGSEGIAEGKLLGWHFLDGGITGTRNRNGFVNFYDLHAQAEYYSLTGIFTGRVERRQATADDGYYTPITAVTAPNMNVDSALYGDTNYNPGDFALNDTITCEASLLSGGYAIYDVNFLLISDKNAIYAQSHFTPYQKYNAYMNETQPSGAFNIVWHTFENVNIGHTGTVQCAIQTINELGYKSGWVYSPVRMMYSTNYTAAGGMNIFVKYEDGTTSYMGHESPYSSDLNYIDVYNWYHAPYYWGFDTADNPLTLFEGDGVIAQTYDRNASRTAGKTFNINRGDEFDISLYLADNTANNHAPVTFATQMFEQSAYGDRVYCKTSFYDKDLDWNSTKFLFWTSNEGSMYNPLCEKSVNYAYTTNCNPADAPCLTPGASTWIMNECGSDNDCYAEAYFSKRGCASLASGSVVGYCAMQIGDTNGNLTIAQASAQLTVPTYQLFAICDAYTLIGSEKENVIFTNSEPGFVECLVGLDNVSEPSDLNWSIIFENKSLALIETIHDDYMDQDYFKFRIDATEELEALARIKSTDGETWEGDGTVFVQHPVYGSKDAAVHITVTFVGSRTGDGAAGEYTEAEFNQLYYWIDGFVKDIMTDPIGTVQARFFEVLVITLFIIIFVPLLLIMGALEAKKKSAGE